VLALSYLLFGHHRILPSDAHHLLVSMSRDKSLFEASQSCSFHPRCLSAANPKGSRWRLPWFCELRVPGTNPLVRTVRIRVPYSHTPFGRLLDRAAHSLPETRPTLTPILTYYPPAEFCARMPGTRSPVRSCVRDFGGCHVPRSTILILHSSQAGDRGCLCRSNRTATTFLS
jgi:hypothetical protein